MSFFFYIYSVQRDVWVLDYDLRAEQARFGNAAPFPVLP